MIALEDKEGVEKAARPENGGFLKPHIFTLTIPQVITTRFGKLNFTYFRFVFLTLISLLHFQIDGGSFLSVKLHWSQKLSYCDGEFSLNVPFEFPEYVTPAIKKIPKKEKILLNVNAGTGTEILCKTSSHPLKVHVCLVLS